MARYKRMPVIIFNIPGLVPLVPGGTAYRAVRNLVLGNISQAVTQSISVIMVAGAIAVGFMFAQILADITRKEVVCQFGFQDTKKYVILLLCDESSKSR
ncbi:threonine/serine exporter family protein [Latilactobacillus sakei]|uniref:threonine/serine exporter family protein n=1 Tax=Latilactobacillus sakei TaxID=1599 RepID=UPI0039F24C53